MKALFLNDTRSAQHVGCELVMANSLRECQRVGMEVTALWTTVDCKEPLLDRLPEVDFDLLLINGEGSMHHDRPLPRHLCEAAEWAAARGKRTVLFNSLWEGNEALNRSLGAFDRIYCRDSASAETVRAAGAEARCVPDMVFATDPFTLAERIETETNDLTVIDSIDRKTSVRLSRFAAYHGYPFLHMDRIGYERLRKNFFARTGWFERKGDLVLGFVSVMRASRCVLSGRFHGTCLAMVLGIPAVSVRSNTRKLETLHRDIGLPESAVLREAPKRRSKIEEVMARAESAGPEIRRYVDEARTAIRDMFDDIARVASQGK